MRGKNIATLSREIGFYDFKPLSLALKSFVDSEKFSRPQFAKADESIIQKIAKAFFNKYARRYWGVAGRVPFYLKDEELILNNLTEILIKQRRNVFDALQAQKRKHGDSSQEPDNVEDEDVRQMGALLEASVENGEAERPDALLEASENIHSFDADSTRGLSITTLGSSRQPTTDGRLAGESLQGGHRSLSHEGDRPHSRMSATVHIRSSPDTRGTNKSHTAPLAPDSRKRKFHEVDATPLSRPVSTVAESAGAPEKARVPVTPVEISAPCSVDIDHTQRPASLPQSPSNRQVPDSKDSAAPSAQNFVAEETDDRCETRAESTVIASNSDVTCQAGVIGRRAFTLGDARYSIDRADLEGTFLWLIGQFESTEFDIQSDLREARKKGNEKETSVAEGRLKQLRQWRLMIKHQLMSRGALEEYE